MCSDLGDQGTEHLLAERCHGRPRAVGRPCCCHDLLTQTFRSITECTDRRLAALHGRVRQVRLSLGQLATDEVVLIGDLTALQPWSQFHPIVKRLTMLVSSHNLSLDLWIVGHEDDLYTFVKQRGDGVRGERDLMVRVVSRERVVEDNDRTAEQLLPCQEGRQTECIELAVAEHTNGVADLRRCFLRDSELRGEVHVPPT
jgi:hypothetical protein